MADIPMQNFGYKIVAEPTPYTTIREDIRKVLMVIFFLTAVAVCWWSIGLALVVLVFAGIIAITRVFNNERFFIKAFYIWDDKVVIDYRDKTEYKQLSGATADFDIRVKKVPRGSYFPRDYYMEVYFKGKQVIMQEETNGWTTEMFRNLKRQL